VTIVPFHRRRDSVEVVLTPENDPDARLRALEARVALVETQLRREAAERAELAADEQP
jgi:hypothetical protein